MFKCIFIYEFPNGGSSDSVTKSYDVHVVPSVGDTLFLPGKDESSTKNVVQSVVHEIKVPENAHEIRVYYSGVQEPAQIES